MASPSIRYCPPPSRPPCNFVQCSKSMLHRFSGFINGIFAAILGFFTTILFFALIALMSFFLPFVVKMWSPELTSLQMTVDRMAKEMARAEDGLKASECGICKLCQQTNMFTSGSWTLLDKNDPARRCCMGVHEKAENKPLSYNNGEARNLDSVKGETNNRNVQPKLVEDDEFVFDDIFIRNDGKEIDEKNSLAFCRTSRDLYKLPLRNEHLSIDLVTPPSNQGAPDIPSVLGRPRQSAEDSEPYVASKGKTQNSKNSNGRENSMSPKDGKATDNAVKSQFRDRA